MNNKEPRLYHDLAWVWQIISPAEDYIKITEFYSKMINIYAKRDIQTLLHLGCGGGHNDKTFKKHFKVTGVDISEDVLYFAKKLNKEVSYIQGDMQNIRFKSQFDAVVLLDAIYYMKNELELILAFETAYENLNYGGVLMVCPGFTKETFKQNKTITTNHFKNGVDIVFLQNYYDSDPKDTTFTSTLVFLIRERGKLNVEVDNHTCGLFPIDTWKKILTDIGFEIEIVDYNDPGSENVPIYICLKK
ncbi:class I SAM-dependent methyltransferase [Candidatus Dependentiae bacterium]|nr:class I SAM-dependent methyltransferase [Candidatus Dependentiae bacterium]